MIGGTITEGGTSIEYAHGGSLFISSGDESFFKINFSQEQEQIKILDLE